MKSRLVPDLTSPRVPVWRILTDTRTLTFNLTHYVTTTTPDETEMLALTLAEVLPEADEGPPAPWDARGEYRCSNVEVYFQVRRRFCFVLWESK